MDYLPEMVLNRWEKYNLHTQHVNVSNNEDALKRIADGEIDGFVVRGFPSGWVRNGSRNEYRKFKNIFPIGESF